MNGANGTYLTISFNRLSDPADITYHIEYSPDMVTWTEDGVLVSSVSNGTGVLAQTWRSPNVVTSYPSLFVHVRVTSP